MSETEIIIGCNINSKCTNLPIVAATNKILSTKKNPLTDNTRRNKKNHQPIDEKQNERKILTFFECFRYQNPQMRQKQNWCQLEGKEEDEKT